MGKDSHFYSINFDGFFAASDEQCSQYSSCSGFMGTHPFRCRHKVNLSTKTLIFEWLDSAVS